MKEETKAENIKNDYKYKKITHQIIGAGMRVHSELGNGFREILYHRALQIEFTKNGLHFDYERSLPVFYKDIKVGSRRVDFLVEDKILVEIKAFSEINNQHISQVLNYLKAFKLEVAILLNFGENSLNFRRISTLKEYPKNLINHTNL